MDVEIEGMAEHKTPSSGRDLSRPLSRECCANDLKGEKGGIDMPRWRQE